MNWSEVSKRIIISLVVLIASWSWLILTALPESVCWYLWTRAYYQTDTPRLTFYIRRKMVGLSDRRNNILQSNGFYEQFPAVPQLFNLPQRAYEYKYEGGSDLCRPARERVARWREKGKKEGRKDDSILAVPFYVAVNVYAPDFSTYPRQFEVPPCWELTNFYESPSFFFFFSPNSLLLSLFTLLRTKSLVKYLEEISHVDPFHRYLPTIVVQFSLFSFL